jgi:hypothetical protein
LVQALALVDIRRLRGADVDALTPALAELRHGNRNVGVETLKRLLRRG